MQITKIGSALLAGWLLCIANTTFASTDDELSEFQAAIRAKYDLKEQAFANDDPKPIVEQFYAEDAFSVDNEGHAHAGREALRSLYAEVVPGARVRIESMRSKVKGDLGWDWANFDVIPDDPLADAFSFIILFLWERRAGEWVCVGDMYVLGRLQTAAEAAL